jgi:hypothetical protein
MIFINLPNPSGAVPTGSQANMDLWYSTLGLYQPKQQKYYTKIPQ